MPSVGSKPNFISAGTKPSTLKGYGSEMQLPTGVVNQWAAKALAEGNTQKANAYIKEYGGILPGGKTSVLTPAPNTSKLTSPIKQTQSLSLATNIDPPMSIPLSKTPSPFGGYVNVPATFDNAGAIRDIPASSLVQTRQTYPVTTQSTSFVKGPDLNLIFHTITGLVRRISAKTQWRLSAKE